MDDSGKRDGMDRAYRHAHQHWKQCFMEAIKYIAERKPTFNTDDVVLACRERHPDATTHEKRAIGPLMKEAAKQRYCKLSHHWFESRQKICHGRPMRTWVSLIYRGPAVTRPRRRRDYDPRQIPLQL